MIKLLNFISTFLSSIGNLIITIIKFAINVFISMLHFVTTIPLFANFINDSIVLLPSFLVPYLTFAVALSIILIFLNRKFGG